MYLALLCKDYLCDAMIKVSGLSLGLNGDYWDTENGHVLVVDGMYVHACSQNKY